MTAFSNVADAAFLTERPHIRQVLVLVVFDLTIAAIIKITISIHFIWETLVISYLVIQCQSIGYCQDKEQ